MMKAVNQGSICFYRAADLPGLELVKGTDVVHSFPRHSHGKYCIGIIETGCRRFSCHGAVNTIIPGDILLIGPNEAHACSALDQTGHSYRMLCLEPDYLQRMLAPERISRRQELPCFITKIITNPAYFRKLSRLFSILAESGSVLEKGSVLLATLRDLNGGPGHNLPLPTRDEPKSVQLIREYLEANYAENLAIEQLSQIAGLSPYHLIRVFGAKTGLPPHSFQTQIRVKQARSKLLQGQSIMAAALETGFVDQSHFTKTFKKLVGVTPGEFINGTA